MKTKLLAIVLSILCLIQPVAALGIVGVEIAQETTVDAGVFEEAALASNYSDDSSILAKEDFEDGFTVGQGFSYVKSAVPATGTIGQQSTDYTVSPVAFDGKNVLKVSGTSSKWNMTGIKLFTLPITGAGSYELTIDYYLESGEYANFGTWDVSIWSQTAYTSTFTMGQWKTVTLPFTVTVNASDSSKYDVLPYSPLGAAGTQYTAQTSIPTFAPSITTKTAYGEFSYYVDNITWKKLSLATITYKDSAGNLLKEVSVKEGDVITLASAAELGIDYIPSYTINGVPHMSSTYTVPGDVTIVVGKSNIVLYDNFESTAADFNTANSPAFAINNGGLNTYFGNGDVGSGTITTIDGNKVMLVSGSLGQWNNIGIKLFNLPIVNVGKYVLSFKANRQRSALFPDITQWSGYHMNFYTGNYNNFKAVNDEEWVTYKETFEVVDTNGTKSINWTRDDGSSGTLTYNAAGLTNHFYMIANGAETATDGKVTLGTTMQWYLDDIALTFEAPKEPANISFADTSGEKLDYTTTAISTYTLPAAEALGLAYEPQYTYKGVTYYPGETFTTGDDVEIEFVVSNSEVILHENFDSHSSAVTALGIAPDYKIGIAASATVEKAQSGSYAFAAFDGKKVLKNTAAGEWGGGLAIKNLSLNKPGKYTIEFNVYAEIPENVTYKMFCTTIRNAANTEVVGQNFSDKILAGKWTTWSYTVEVYEKDGALWIKEPTLDQDKALTDGYIPTYYFYTQTPGATTDSPAIFYYDYIKVSYTSYAPETVEMASYRVDNENNLGGFAGIRFASYVTGDKKAACTEYGFVVTRKELITTNGIADYAKLHLNGLPDDRSYAISGKNTDNVLVIAGAAYNDSVNRIYANDGRIFNNGTVSYAGVFETFFTGVVYNIPEGHETDIFVARPYIIVDGVCYYGNCYESSYEAVYSKANS